MIEKELRMEWDRVFYPEPEPEETDMTDQAPMDVQVAEAGPGSAAFGVFPQMKPRRAGSSELGANLPVLAADALAAGGRGGFTGITGLFGDAEAIIRGLVEIGRRGGDEGKIDAFFRGMTSGTILPTSDDVDKWLDKNVGPVVPAGVAMEQSRKKAAGAGRLAGEVVADPVAAVKGAKLVGKAAKDLAPKAAEMAIEITEKTGVPVRGLGVVENSPKFEKAYPRVDSIERFPVGPSSIKPKVIAQDKPLYRETNASNLDDFLREDGTFSYANVFVTDNPDLAIGQGQNKGVLIQFRKNAVSGEEHKKPMTGDLAGREYKADVFAPRAIESITFANEKDITSLRGVSRNVLKRDFVRTTEGKKDIVFVRKDATISQPVQEPK